MSEGIRLGWWLSAEEHDPRALVRHARLAEQAGFTTAMISDHLQPWVRHQGNAPHVWSVIGAISHATDSLEVGTGVTAMVHRNHPIAVAQAACTVAVMLEDRFFLGVGAGERLNEDPFGAGWPAAGVRRARLEEAVAVIRELCTGRPVTHRGEAWQVEGLALATFPTVPPPIYMAASATRSASSAGACGDGLIGVAPDSRLVDAFRHAGGHGKPTIAQLHVSLATDHASALANAWEWWPQAVVPPSIFGELASPRHFEALAKAIGEEPLGDAIVCATDAGVVIDAIDRYVAAGFDTVYLHQVGPHQQRLADMAAHELLPHYRAVA